MYYQLDQYFWVISRNQSYLPISRSPYFAVFEALIFPPKIREIRGFDCNVLS